MNGKTMDERVTDLEKLAESLAPLPARMEAVEGRLVDVDRRIGTVESQIVQLRTEMRIGFSTARRETRVLHEEVIRRIALIGEGRAPEA
jgi:hypothetical protein